MANAGIKGGQAGTALRGMLTNLSKPTTDVAEAMKKYGISLTDASGNMNRVYALPDAQGRVTAVDSDANLSDPTGWTQVDQGDGDRYRHAQGNYLPGPLMKCSVPYTLTKPENLPT